MGRSLLEVADIFRSHGRAWRNANRGHVSLDQMKVMGAIERCRTAALGGHVARCENSECGHTHIAYNSCRNRHCPKCQGAAARDWLADRKAELLPVGYFHVVFTLPAAIADIAFQNKRVIYDILFKASIVHRAFPTRRDDAGHCRRPQIPWRKDRDHVGIAYVGQCHDASPACPHDCASMRSMASP